MVLLQYQQGKENLMDRLFRVVFAIPGLGNVVSDAFCHDHAHDYCREVSHLFPDVSVMEIVGADAFGMPGMVL